MKNCHDRLSAADSHAKINREIRTIKVTIMYFPSFLMSECIQELSFSHARFSLNCFHIPWDWEVGMSELLAFFWQVLIGRVWIRCWNCYSLLVQNSYFYLSFLFLFFSHFSISYFNTFMFAVKATFLICILVFHLILSLFQIYLN